MRLDITQDYDKAHHFDYETATTIIEKYNESNHKSSLQAMSSDKPNLVIINVYNSEYEIVGFLASNQLAS